MEDTIVRPLFNEKFIWPTIEEIRRLHQQSDILSQLDDRDKRALTLHKSADGIIRTDYDQIWISTKELKLKICIIEHSASEDIDVLKVRRRRLSLDFIG